MSPIPKSNRMKKTLLSTVFLLTAALVSTTASAGGREGHGGKAKYGDQFYFIVGKLQCHVKIELILEGGLSVRPTYDELRADGNPVDMLSYIEAIDENSGERSRRSPGLAIRSDETRVTAMSIPAWNEMDCRAKYQIVLHELLVHRTIEKSQDYHWSSPVIEELDKAGKVSCDDMPVATASTSDKGAKESSVAMASKEHFVVDSMTLKTRCEKNKNLLGDKDAAFKRLIPCTGELVVVELDAEYFRTRKIRIPINLRVLTKGVLLLSTDMSGEAKGMRTHDFILSNFEGKKLKDVFGKYSGSMFALAAALGGYSEGGTNASEIRIENTNLKPGGLGIAGGLREYSLQPRGTIVDVEIFTNTPGNPVQSVQESIDLEYLYETEL